MTDLSKFDGHTDGPWLVTIFGGECAEIWATENGDSATNIDVELMNAAPALLARVKELEEALGVLKQCFPEGSGGREKLTELLNKEWL